MFVSCFLISVCIALSCAQLDLTKFMHDPAVLDCASDESLGAIFVNITESLKKVRSKILQYLSFLKHINSFYLFRGKMHRKNKEETLFQP